MYDINEAEVSRRFRETCRLLNLDHRIEHTRLLLIWLRRVQDMATTAITQHIGKIERSLKMAETQKLQIGKKRGRPTNEETAARNAAAGVATVAGTAPPPGADVLLGALGLGPQAQTPEVAGGPLDLGGPPPPNGNGHGNGGPLTLAGLPAQQVDLTGADINLGINAAQILNATGLSTATTTSAAPSPSVPAPESELLISLVGDFEVFKAETNQALDNVQTQNIATQEALGKLITFAQKELEDIGAQLAALTHVVSALQAPTQTAPAAPPAGGPGSVPPDAAQTLRAAYQQLYKAAEATGFANNRYDAADIAGRLATGAPPYTANQYADFMQAIGYPIKDGEIIIEKA